MAQDDQIKALLPDLINGKTHQQLMDECEANAKKSGHHVVNGILFPSMAPRSNVDALNTFEVRDDDVFLISYPRSGIHWVAEIIKFILNDGKDDFDRAFMTTGGLEFTFPLGRETGTPGYQLHEATRSPRFITSHCPESFLPPQVFAKQAKVVYVARNPKDVIVSNFKLIKSVGNGSASDNFNEFLWSFYYGQGCFGSWFDHVTKYWRHEEEDNFLFLKYENLQKDLRGSVCKLAKYFVKDLSNDVIDCITERITLDGMRQTYQKLEDVGGDESKMMTRAFGIAPFLRRGKTGGWKDNFTLAQSALFDMIYDLKMQGTGLEFDFEI